MIVKIKNRIYDSEDQPIMLILSDDDKFNISHMGKKYAKYLSYPETISTKDAKAFMKITKKYHKGV